MSRNPMWNLECGMRNRNVSVDSAFRIPHSALTRAMLLLALTACSRDHRTPLVVYSPHGRDLLSLFEHRFEALHPDIDVRWLDMGSQDVYDRVRSERANPQADIWFGGPSLILAAAARDSLLDCLRPAWAAAIPARARGAGDCYFAAYETPVGRADRVRLSEKRDGGDRRRDRGRPWGEAPGGRARVRRFRGQPRDAAGRGPRGISGTGPARSARRLAP